MVCLKCCQPLDSGLKCWGCGIQYQLVEKANSAEFINYQTYPATSPYYDPKDEYIQWEY